MNNSPAQNDDVVRLQDAGGRYEVECRARIVGTTTGSKKIVFTNPDGRLRFPNPGDTTVTRSLSSSGAWSTYPIMISGESASDSLNDAIIEAHWKKADGALVGQEDVTVFYFDNASTHIEANGTFRDYFGFYTSYPQTTVDYELSARIRPAGVDCSVPQITNLRVSMVQNLSSTVRTWKWDTPRIQWKTGVPPGTQVTVKKMYLLTLSFPTRWNDCTNPPAFHDPLYYRGGNAMAKPIGCTNGGIATTSDTPSTPMTDKWVIDAISDTDGTVVGKVVYSHLVNVTMDDYFIVWTVIFDSATDKIVTLRQRHWSLNVDSAGGTGQTASVDTGDTEPTIVPVTGPPWPNQEAGKAIYYTEGGYGSEEQTFTK